MTWASLSEAVLATRIAELETVEPVSVYRGKPIPAGKKSVALRMTFRSKTETLTREQADEMQARVLAALAKAVAAVLRT